MKIIVIGANGLLGSDLVSNLSKDFEVIRVTKENYDSQKDKSCDVLINANGNSRRFWANEHVLEDFQASTVSVYHSLFDFSFKKYIYISSSDVYENHTSPETTKEDRRIDVKKLSPYGLHKYLSERIVMNATSDFIILRSSMMLGKNLKKGPIFDILHDKELFITKESKLQMITTEEVARIVKTMIVKRVSGEIFNIGGKGTVTVSSIESFAKKSVAVRENAEQQVYEMNVEKLESYFPLQTSDAYLQEYLKKV